MRRLPAAKFRRKYRKRRASFEQLVAMLRPALEKPRSRGGTPGGAIDIELKVGATLRYLSGGSYLDIASDHGISESYFYFVVEEVLDAMNQKLGNFGLTEETVLDAEYLKDLAEDMSKYWGDALHGVVAAFDCWACPIKRPHDADYQPYRNRKGFFAYVVQVCVDARRKLIHMRCKEKGAANDSLVFRTSTIGQAILAGKVPQPYIFLGDAAYPLHRSLMVPYGGKGNDVWKDSFDFWQSHYRMNVECALGALQRRFGIFWRPLEVHQSKVWLIISACMRLHNWLIDIDDTVLSTAYEEDMPSRPECIPITMQSDGAADEGDEADHNRERMGKTKEQVRDDLTKRLREVGLTRPGKRMRTSTGDVSG
mmetsp:Transcript_7437/g.21776  ORF Transcript_7437/g.21776 Transcript_7437/m.21776 type:complete len:367 (-) Transcript_7437:64-1164(-)